MKKRILELLELSSKANSDMGTYRLELLANINADKSLMGEDFLIYLDEMTTDGFVISNENKSIYKITNKGSEFLLKK